MWIKFWDLFKAENLSLLFIYVVAKKTLRSSEKLVELITVYCICCWALEIAIPFGITRAWYWSPILLQRRWLSLWNSVLHLQIWRHCCWGFGIVSFNADLDCKNYRFLIIIWNWLLYWHSKLSLGIIVNWNLQTFTEHRKWMVNCSWFIVCRIITYLADFY